jgi:hypothetical protein
MKWFESVSNGKRICCQLTNSKILSTIKQNRGKAKLRKMLGNGVMAGAYRE